MATPLLGLAYHLKFLTLKAKSLILNTDFCSPRKAREAQRHFGRAPGVPHERTVDAPAEHTRTKFGRCWILRFDGDDDFCGLASENFLPILPTTIVFWFRSID